MRHSAGQPPNTLEFLPLQHVVVETLLVFDFSASPEPADDLAGARIAERRRPYQMPPVRSIRGAPQPVLDLEDAIPAVDASPGRQRPLPILGVQQMVPTEVLHLVE